MYARYGAYALYVLSSGFSAYILNGVKINKMIEKVSIKDLASHVEKYFNKDFLKSDFRLGDSLRKERKNLEKAINFFKSKRMSAQKKEKCEKLILELEDLHEQAIKKKNQEKEARNKTQRPLYYIDMPTKTDANIYFGFRTKRIRNSL